jgi:aspartate/methionine/tyrosine aminotransferase
MSAPILSAISRRGRAGRVYDESNSVGEDVIDLSSDETGGLTSNHVRAETIAAVGQHLADHYTRRPGILSLAQAVADLLARDAIAVDVANGIIIAGGVQEARFIGMCAVASNKTIYLPQPSCLSDYAAAALFANSRLEHFDPADTLPDSQGGVVLLSNPNPATGQVYTREALKRLAHWVVERNLFVISDETLAPLCLPGISMMHLVQMCVLVKRFLVQNRNSFSKVMAWESRAPPSVHKSPVATAAPG